MTRPDKQKHRIMYSVPCMHWSKRSEKIGSHSYGAGSALRTPGVVFIGIRPSRDGICMYVEGMTKRSLARERESESEAYRPRLHIDLFSRSVSITSVP